MLDRESAYALTQSRAVRGAGALLVVGILALLAVVVASHAFGILAQRSFDGVLDARTLSRTADALRDSLQSAESSQRGYVLTGNQIYLAPFGAAKTEVRTHAADLDRALAHRPDVRPALDRLSILLDEKLKEMDESIVLKRDGREADALALIVTNRGKALMDEVNVFVSRFVRVADSQLRDAAESQRHWLFVLRTVNFVAVVLVCIVVAAALGIVWDFAKGLARARDEVQALNVDLERRVEERTADLAAARDRAELLMAEVNHRVANSLTLVASLVNLQVRAAEPGPARDLLSEVHDRIYAIALVHRRLYSTGDVRSVDLGEYLSSLLDQLEVTMRNSGHQGVLKQDLASIQFPTDKSVNLGVIAAELVTNAFKYAYPDDRGEIRVRLVQSDDGGAELTVEDDGVGRADNAAPKGTGLGSKLVGAMAASLEGDVQYLQRRPGTSARVRFPLAAVA